MKRKALTTAVGLAGLTATGAAVLAIATATPPTQSTQPTQKPHTTEQWLQTYSPTQGIVTPAPGDDNGDGTIDEDESGWNCHTMGNGICGPGH
jgi:hypothetical protein